ncbi:MAG TPA: DegT/DnrJ/EryC1/StrS family aminotransferase [Candidatus Limnocylindrales bacterium]|jgi:dTDP-4-amino-4,6-dideoxygalactose transaminase|nr:DegT/DnrJ/EryC1/StrS family aminotransferase [Candidatus Limnocylindrales bacterium]
MSSPAKRAEDSALPASPRFDFLDLRAQFATIHDEVMQAVAQVFESQYFILGPEVKLLEDEVAAKLGAKFAVGCASGTDALILSLLAAGIDRGDEVITTPFSFIATAGAIAYVGAKPIFVDIDPVTYNINPALLEAAITPDTRAIMPVHLFGLPADMEPILAVAHAHDLVIIEDAAQAIGSRYSGRCTGTLGDYGCFSFFPSKNLGGAGDGGLITTNDPAIAERLQMLRVHGSKKKYFHEMIGTNSRLHALQAAVLRVKLRHLDAWQHGRQNRADRYRRLFESAGLASFITAPPQPPAKFEHVYNQFTIRFSRRDDLKSFLQSAGVPSEIYYPLSIHLQQAFAYLGHTQGDFPESEKASREVLSLPVYPELPDAQQDRVVQAIADFK